MFGQDGWILAVFFFCEFMDLDVVSVHKHAKKELGQYPAILTSHLVNNPYVLSLLFPQTTLFFSQSTTEMFVTEQSAKDVEVGLFFMISTVEKLTPCCPCCLILQALASPVIFKLEISYRIVCVVLCVMYRSNRSFNIHPPPPGHIPGI